jgi:hypothetical protein
LVNFLAFASTSVNIGEEAAATEIEVVFVDGINLTKLSNEFIFFQFKFFFIKIFFYFYLIQFKINIIHNFLMPNDKN